MVWPAIAAIASVASVGFGIAGAAQSDAARKKMVESQDKAAKQNYDYTWGEMQDRYNYEQDATNIARGNERNERKYREQVARDEYNRQNEIQRAQYRGQRDAYRASVNDYRQQLDLNKMSLQLGNARETQAFRDAQTDRMFADASAMRDLTALTNQAVTRRDSAANNYRSEMNSINQRRADSREQLKSTLASNRNEIKRNNAALNQERKQYDADARFTAKRQDLNNQLSSKRVEQLKLQQQQNRQELKFNNKERALLDRRGQKELDLRNQGRDIQINQSLDQDKFIRSNTKNTVDELRSQLGLNNRDRSIRANDAISNRDFNNAERASQIDELRNSLQIDAASRQNQTGSIQERVASQLAMSANEREQLDNELDNLLVIHGETCNRKKLQLPLRCKLVRLKG